MRAFIGQWRKILHQIVIGTGQHGAATPKLFKISLSRAMRIEIVFDNWNTHFPRCHQGMSDFFNLLVPAGPPINTIRKPIDHQIAECYASSLQFVDDRLQLIHFPWDYRDAREGVSNPSLNKSADYVVRCAVVEVDDHGNFRGLPDRKSTRL